MFSHEEKLSIVALHLALPSAHADKLENQLYPGKIEPAARFLLKDKFQKAYANAREIWQKHESKNIHAITIIDPGYPALLKETRMAPLVLFCKGNISLLNEKKISIVGTRKPSITGIQITGEITRQLVKEKYTIVSGMAMGIDSSAHYAALDHNGKTIGVLAHGCDHEYPVCNQKLYHKAEKDENILLISEYAYGVKPLRHHFLRRNRIISGLSEKTIFAEGGIKSGGLITVRYALEQGRDVLAVAHEHMTNNAGGEELIRDGAVNLAQLLEVEISHRPELLTTNPPFYLGTGKWAKIKPTDHLTRLIEF